MIVISGALVLVALILLVIGLVSTALGFVYASIAVSVVSFAFLIIGILQRRGEPLPAAAPADAAPAPESPSDIEGVTAIIPAGSRPPAAARDGGPAEPAAAHGGTEPADAATPAVAGGSVLVVAGRPRYHVAGCRYLTGRNADVVPVEVARGDGFAPCGVCRPDAALLAVASDAGGPADAAGAAPTVAVSPPAAVEEPALPDVPDPVVAARKTTTRAPSRRKPTAVPAEEALPPAARAARVAPAPLPATSVSRPRTGTARTGTARPAGAEAATPPSTRRTAAATDRPAPARAVSARAAGVVVIPDGSKYHRPDCRFVRDAPEAADRTKAQATRQGYAACGVCKP